MPGVASWSHQCRNCRPSLLSYESGGPCPACAEGRDGRSSGCGGKWAASRAPTTIGSMAMIEEALIEEAGRRLSAAAPDAELILFGSRARGEPRPDSDLDLLIIEPDFDRRGEEYGRLRRELRGLDVAIDSDLPQARGREMGQRAWQLPPSGSRGRPCPHRSLISPNVLSRNAGRIPASSPPQSPSRRRSLSTTKLRVV